VLENIPDYAILSHTWGQTEDEVSFRDVDERPSGWQFKPGYNKIQLACKQAIEDGLSWIWIDTCCIDKSSSAELFEAINSMYTWYERAGTNGQALAMHTWWVLILAWGMWELPNGATGT